jgi:sigma-54 specific flagellar transcriptional regulator A
MWRETKILLIDDDSVRRRDLAVILNFLGEENLPCGSHDWQQAVSSLPSSREVICVLIGTVNAPGGGNFVDVMWFQSLVDFIQPHSQSSSTV